MLAQAGLKPKQWELKGRVLIVEDDEIMGKWLLRKLKNCGLDSEWVANAPSALRELSNKRYHAVVSDIFLDDSKTGGLDLVSKVKELDIPVIVITAKADLEMAKKCLNSGVHQFLEKPFEIDQLIQSLTDVWENPRGLSTLVERFLESNCLTETEKKIARLALKGLSNREIADVNGNTEKTVKFHMTVIYDKCNVGSRGEFFNSVVPT
ncbi:MAG: Two-component response regulator [Bacteriovoracaceae bacterium]|nr:Two-component response regulator [Bacteriovoracaceae bacterium]